MSSKETPKTGNARPNSKKLSPRVTQAQSGTALKAYRVNHRGVRALVLLHNPGGTLIRRRLDNYLLRINIDFLGKG